MWCVCYARPTSTVEPIVDDREVFGPFESELDADTWVREVQEAGMKGHFAILEMTNPISLELLDGRRVSPQEPSGNVVEMSGKGRMVR